jgi:hypothetical protein
MRSFAFVLFPARFLAATALRRTIAAPVTVPPMAADARPPRQMSGIHVCPWRPKMKRHWPALVVATLAQAALLLPAWAQLQTTIVPSLPALPDDPQVSRDTSPMVCRPPQRLSDTRLLGPAVCKTQRQWDDLHARGLDLSIDGRSTITTSQKYRSLNTPVCRSATDCPP